MVEGHSCARLCRSFNQKLAGRVFVASSPNSRFLDGAKKISKRKLIKLDHIGKNVFAFFEGNHVIHFHFGMSGRFALFDKDSAPEPTPTTRLRLEDSKFVAHLSCMSLNYGDEDLFNSKKQILGQDPLRSDSDPDLLFAKIQKSKQSIGRLLMDQSFFAGVGNIYRAEILFKAGVHPNIKATSVNRKMFDTIWLHTCSLLQRGFECGSILTVDKEEAKKLGKPNLRRYIYNQKKCPRCSTSILSWDMAGRTCYACPTCQPISGNEGELPASAAEVRVFQSHCARDSLQERLLTPEKLSVKELKVALSDLAEPTKGRKKELIQRLKDAMEKAGAARSTDPKTPSSRQKRKREPSSSPEGAPVAAKHVKRGSKHLAAVSAKEAAKEKQLAGEKLNVEHVAEFDQTGAQQEIQAIPSSRRTSRRSRRLKSTVN